MQCATLIAPYVMVYHDCTGDYVMRGEPRLLDSIAPHKTLFGAAPSNNPASAWGGSGIG